MTVDWWAVEGAPPPKFATRRDHQARTLGTMQAHFAEVWLSHALMPWQRYVADVAGELLPTGRPRYPLVVVTVPRQAGKSHLAMAQVGERCFSVPKFRAWYTAQTGQDAADQFLKFHTEVVTGTPLERVVATKVGNGRQVMGFPNGSTLRPFPPTEEAMHGKQGDRDDIDEAWAFADHEGEALLQAIAPTQLTRPNAQTWIWSAGGTAASTWLAELVARGRAGDPDMAYFEWGMPDDMPVSDLEGIARHHPAYGHTVDLEAVRRLRANLTNDAAFARAAGNRWTEVIGGAIDAEEWADARHAGIMPEGTPLGWGAARAADGSQVVVAAATLLPGGEVLAEVVDVLPAHGAAAAVKGWASGATLAVARNGASASLADDLERLRVDLLPMTGQAETAACGSVLDGLKARAYRFRPHPALDAAVLVTGKRRTTGGGHVWAPTAAGAPIAALEAVTSACHAVKHLRPRIGKPETRWAS